MNPARDLHRHDGSISRRERERRLGQRGCIVWITGLSGAGKSTLARALEARLHGEGRSVYVLDGDNVRHGLCADLGFAPAERSENIRRVAHVAALLADAGLIVLVALVSPFRADRAQARAIAPHDFVEVFADAPLPACERRDPKGLYAKARAGQLRDFTGIDSPYEPPTAPDVHLATGDRALADCVAALHAALAARGVFAPPATP
jgi:adenylyl-sulfate kinase